MATSPLVPLIEAAVNRLLARDPRAGECLEGLSGRLVEVRVVGLPLTLYLSFPAGSVHVGSSALSPPDVSLSGTPVALLRLAFTRRGQSALLGRDVEVRGDVGVLERLRACLAALDPDWEEALAARIGDVPAHALVRQVRSLSSWLAAGRATLGENLQEYLWEEARVLPRPEAVEDLARSVDRLRDDAERLAKRVERLARRLEGG